MKSKINLNTILIALVILLAGSWSAYSQRQITAPTPTKWEYTTRTLASIETVQPEKVLNGYGRDGWELVGVMVQERDIWVYHFKRTVQ